MQAKIIKLAGPHACTRMEDARSIRRVATLKAKSYLFFLVRYYTACVYLYASTCAFMVIHSGNPRHDTSSTYRHDHGRPTRCVCLRQHRPRRPDDLRVPHRHGIPVLAPGPRIHGGSVERCLHSLSIMRNSHASRRWNSSSGRRPNR